MAIGDRALDAEQAAGQVHVIGAERRELPEAEAREEPHHEEGIPARIGGVTGGEVLGVCSSCCVSEATG